MKLVLLILMTLYIANVSCYNDSSKKSELKIIPNDSFIREIPAWYEKDNLTQKVLAKLHTLLELESLQNGFDSLQIRILIDCGNKISNLVVLDRREDKWNAVFYSFKIYYDEKLDFEIQKLNIKSRFPKSGWKSFYEDLIETGVIDLPDHMKFYPEYNLPTDGDRVLVEISTLKKYRLYEYPELVLNSNIAEGPGKLLQALKLIETEFTYKRPCQNSIGD